MKVHARVGEIRLSEKCRMTLHPRNCGGSLFLLLLPILIIVIILVVAVEVVVVVAVGKIVMLWIVLNVFPMELLYVIHHEDQIDHFRVTTLMIMMTMIVVVGGPRQRRLLLR